MPELFCGEDCPMWDYAVLGSETEAVQYCVIPGKWCSEGDECCADEMDWIVFVDAVKAAVKKRGGLWQGCRKQKAKEAQP